MGKRKRVVVLLAACFVVTAALAGVVGWRLAGRDSGQLQSQVPSTSPQQPGLTASSAPRPSPTEGVATGTQTQPGKAVQRVPLRDVDWSRARVPAACADVSFAPLKNYRFETPGGGRVVVEPAEIVTGIVSTRVATLIRVRCEGASSSSDEAMLYVDTPDGVALAGYVVGPNESVDGVSFDGGVLRLQGFTNSPEAPRCCPDIVTESAWVLQGDVVQNLSYQARATVEVDGTDPSTCTLLGEVRANVALVGREIVDLQGGSVQGIPTYNKAATLQNLSAISALRSNHTTLGQIQRRLSPSC